MSTDSFDYSTIGKTSSYIAKQQAEAEAAKSKSLDQEDFLKLLTTQLTNQDPSEPVDNNQMVTTMAQLSVVDNLNTITSGMNEINDSITSSTALTASSLVGRSVLVDSQQAFFDGSNQVTAKIDAGDGTSNISIDILDSHGTLVGSYSANAGSGSMDFTWDGQDSEGNAYPAGMYTIQASGTQNGNSVSLPVSTYATVSSVTLGNTLGETTLSLIGQDDVTLNRVKEFSL
ncbi:MAG: flagellar hook assembly protein FlgD [Succinivibrio sp.]|nr:flagellar hook assembly protein FlgD [Succinivibrio sp.]